jgi:hypothetical protein
LSRPDSGEGHVENNDDECGAADGVESNADRSSRNVRDIIATPENPLDNIQTLKKVSFVMKNGRS